MSNYLGEIKKVISEKTGLESYEIGSDSFIADDLNIGEMELMDILEELEDKFHVNNLVDNSDSFETIQDIIDALEEHI